MKEPRTDRSRRNDKRRLQSPASDSDGGNDDWIDASDDDSSVDSALAYGGGLSARQSKESLGSIDGTDKWAWRWNNEKKRQKKPSQDLSRFQPAVAGPAGSAIDQTAIQARPFRPAESTASLQSMQQLDPLPMSDTNAFMISRRGDRHSPSNSFGQQECGLVGTSSTFCSNFAGSLFRGGLYSYSHVQYYRATPVPPICTTSANHRVPQAITAKT